jgi:tripartite-type tricarboxylate transporter receptor subunit TctC
LNLVSTIAPETAEHIMNMRARHLLLLIALAAILPAAQAQTGNWPDKPVRVVVPMPAGGTSDV